MKTQIARGRKRAARLEDLARCAEEIIANQRRSHQPEDPTVTSFALIKLAEACIAQWRDHEKGSPVVERPRATAER
jgi:hypothetical protein